MSESEEIKPVVRIRIVANEESVDAVTQQIRKALNGIGMECIDQSGSVPSRYDKNLRVYLIFR